MSATPKAMWTGSWRKPLAADRTHLAARALRYTQYDFFKRQIMKLIVWRGGGPTDAGRDYEFTDWDALSKFVDSFLEKVRS